MEILIDAPETRTLKQIQRDYSRSVPPPLRHPFRAVAEFFAGLMILSLLVWLLSGISVWQFLLLAAIAR